MVVIKILEILWVIVMTSMMVFIGHENVQSKIVKIQYRGLIPTIFQNSRNSTYEWILAKISTAKDWTYQ